MNMMAQKTIQVVFFDLGKTLVASDTQWNSSAKAVLSALSQAGVRLGIISNTGDLTRPQLKQRLPADFDFSVFEANLVLLSSEVGIEKPQIKIFQLAVERAGVSASQCVYCSEDMKETLAAQRAGMIGARIYPPPDSDLGDIVQSFRKSGLLQ
jgi:HAD superfamily hydrolase (TIGR01549 family)